MTSAFTLITDVFLRVSDGTVSGTIISGSFRRTRSCQRTHCTDYFVLVFKLDADSIITVVTVSANPGVTVRPCVGLHLQRLHLSLEWNLVLGFHDLRKRHKLVDKFLPHHLLDDILVVVIAQSTAELVVIHVGFVLPHTPHSGHLFGILQLEFAIESRPRDEMLLAFVHQEFQEELPQGYVAL